MKRLFASILIVLVTLSCDISDDSPNVYYEFVPIVSVNMSTEMLLNEIYEVTVVYERPTSCHLYHNIYYNPESTFERTVAIISSVYQNSNCEPLVDSNFEVSFNFKPTNIGTYTFQFWQGENEDGESEFLTVEAAVTE